MLTNTLQMRCAHLLLACITLASLLSPTNGLAWGRTGHQISGLIAQQMLTPKARVKLNSIITAADLSAEASWMDEERARLMHQIHGSQKWHYINSPVCPGPAKDVCPNNDCITARIEEYRRVLGDPSQSQPSRAFALRVLVHLVGDIHQPLHTADHDDEGGNAIDVGSTNLHAQWDSGFIKKLTRHQSLDQAAASITSHHASQMASWQSGNPQAWLAESHAIAVNIAYGHLPGFRCGLASPQYAALSPQYTSESIAIVETQLAKAGARIAYVLNSALDPQGR